MRVFWIAIAMTAFLASAPSRSVLAQAAPAHGEAGHKHAEGEHDHAEEEHEHPTEGPHGGSLLELGDEEYHAELVLDEETDQITICLLDSTAEKEVPIEAQFVVINVKTSDKPRQYRLPSLYPEGTTSGPASTFALISPELMDDLHAHDKKARLTVKISKKSYSAALHHHHEEHKHGAKESNTSKTSKSRAPGVRGSRGRFPQHPTMPWVKGS